METRISSKGQFTLPVEARRKLGLKTGDVLKVRLTDEGVLISREKKLHHDLANTLKMLRETSGIWKDMEESGEDYVRQLRSEDKARLKVLGIE